MTARERAMTEATDEEVAQLRAMCQLEATYFPHTIISKLLARLERVEEELESMKLGYRGFP